MTSTFRSRHHPGDKPWGFVYAQALVSPLATCTLPIMIAATAAALQGEAAWGYLAWGFPMALTAASVWTRFALSTTPAEVHIRDGECAVVSVHDVLRDRRWQWTALYDIREAAGSIELYLGWTTYVCRRKDWPQFADLRSRVRRATGAASDRRPTPFTCA